MYKLCNLKGYNLRTGMTLSVNEHALIGLTSLWCRHNKLGVNENFSKKFIMCKLNSNFI